MMSMISMYKQKKKKIVDPNAPPRPTLLGHEKEMKEFRGRFTDVSGTVQNQHQEIQELRRKINRLQMQMDAVVSLLSRNKK
jgi:predicted  nucleic acid-binding Zn-ribbon protein